MYTSISINDPDFKNKLIKNFTEEGIAVINDVFSDSECESYMDNIINDFVQLGTGIDVNDIKKTWTDYNLPPQTRPGLFQTLMSNSTTVWNIRSDDNVRQIFEILYSNSRKKDVSEFIVSGDGINVRPGFVGPFTDGGKDKSKKKDWAHLDQTIKGDIFKCIQGQAVLTNTSASFVASPKSHLVFDDILKKVGCEEETSNWLKFNDDQIEGVKKLIIDKGGKYQIPILAKKGSFIVWLSSVVHSAKLQDKCENPLVGDKYNGWRGVVYVCYRPKEEFSEKEIKKRIMIFDENRAMNHWSTKLFGKKPGSRWLYSEKRHDLVEKMLMDPKLVYGKIGKPVLSDNQKKLIGL